MYQSRGVRYYHEPISKELTVVTEYTYDFKNEYAMEVNFKLWGNWQGTFVVNPYEFNVDEVFLKLERAMELYPEEFI